MSSHHLISRVSAEVHQDPEELLQQSSSMLEQRGTLGRVLLGLQGRTHREQERRLADAVLAEAARVQQRAMEEKSEEAHLLIAVRYQVAKDELRIAHRHTMSELSQLAEDQLEHSLNNIFSIKKQQLDKMAGLAGDPDLLAEAARCLSDLTIASANELIERNTRLE